MAKEILSEVNDRIISLIASFVDRGIYNSERDFLIKNGYQTSKLSEIKSQKTNFKLEDVRYGARAENARREQRTRPYKKTVWR